MNRAWQHLGGYRLRLALAFGLVVLLALGIVLGTLPRLLDDYLREQELDSLDARTRSVAQLIAQEIEKVSTVGTDYQKPIIMETGSFPSASNTLINALGTSRAGYVADLAGSVAQADIHVAIYATPGEETDGSAPVYRVDVRLPDDVAESGEQREPLSASQTVFVRDSWWTQSLGARRRPVTVELSDPFTSRAQTIETINNVLLVAAVIGLAAATLVALGLTQWLADPIRRLIRASRELEDGRLDARVALPASAAPEVTELGDAFNQMAERLEESIDVISADRDRSRDFVADVSHELRTPIAALRTFNELLREGAVEEPETRDEFLEQSARQIERLDWLATNLLELSKLDSGLVRLNLQAEDLRGVVESAVQQAEPVAARKGVDLVMHLPPEGLDLPHDPPRVGQILTNLIGNAIKFTPRGGRVDVELRATPDGARMTVTDTGVGIPAEELPHVFERFWRGAGTRERGSGSGLGLSIVKSIVDMHQGRIQVVSAPGTGTQISVSLPGKVSVSSPTGAPA